MFFIYDANNEIFGNPKGYKTHAIAQRIATRYRHKLWGIYDTRELIYSKSNRIYSIEFIPHFAFS